ncbi:MAG: site-specific integrase [Hydrotalea flava]|uniref:tyrosine-type recombinase/integrase n=1 Tax=Hydrotalea lipotrueae TaxID=2803817 RepID=UPI001C45D089|nr:tyrosine-type recombinase/integrase [Hydrotalea lipotrueae]MBY0349070.1 site-specific integrase [Hydrotalea flava]
MQIIVLKILEHRNAECIGIYFKVDTRLNGIVKKIPGIKWSRTHTCWYLPLNRNNYQLIMDTLSCHASINNAALKKYIIEKKETGNTTMQPAANKPKITSQATSIISNENNKAMAMLVQQLTLKAYSPSTIKTYRNEFGRLLQTIKQKNVDTLTADELRRYMVYTIEKEGISENTAHSRLNALKFYFEQVLGREKFFWEIPRPKKPLLLPKLLNEKELGRLFNALSNKKHKAMLFTAYSAGLRVSEIVELKISDIDSSRMQIFVRRAKGKKDRYVNLSPVLLDILRKYLSEYRPQPKEYLFESEQTNTAYPTRTVQQIFNNAKTKAGIKKEVGVHSLRHSFATHLLDKGTDIRYIKDLLGHFDIKTTERYLHVSKRNLVNISSPLDDLMKKESIEW